MSDRISTATLALVLLAAFALPAFAADPKAETPKAYSPYAGRILPTRPLFGDTHLHTSFSMDAGAFGARLGPRDAYRFARGEEVVSSSEQKVRLSRPLDFLVVADHSDNMGFFPDLFAGQAGGARGSDRPQVVRHDPVRQGRGGRDRDHRWPSRRGRSRRRSDVPAGDAGVPRRPGRRRSPRRSSTTTPGRFTAFIGYEWTSNTGGNNLHRNVDLPRRRATRRARSSRYTTYPPVGSDNPRDLWKWMAARTRRRRAAACSRSRTTAT